MKNIYIIHENSDWTKPLFEELENLNLPYEDWFLNEGMLDLSSVPPEGVFYNRMSASSHTRNHRYAPEYTSSVISWLESHGRKIINNSRALQLEISKTLQYSQLNFHDIRTPHTVAAIGKDSIIKAAKVFSGSFITKHNRAGKGLGVQLFNNIEALEKYVYSSNFDNSLDGITLIQEYIKSPTTHITRCEFIGEKFIYAVKVDTSQGFQLCPADVCQIGDAFCPVGEPQGKKFEIIKDFNNPIIDKYINFIKNNGIQIAGIEFIIDKNGEIYTYDVNTNTNYNKDAELETNFSGMATIAKYLGEELKLLE